MGMDFYSPFSGIIIPYFPKFTKIRPFFPHKSVGTDLYYTGKRGDRMDYIEWFYQRLTELRIQKGVSARDMSLSLGQSESYINKIENKRTLPSFTGFIYICEYFGITPQEFFNIDAAAPPKTRELVREMEKLSPEQTEHILLIVKDLSGK